MEIWITPRSSRYHDGPNPNDILCAVLATCLESTIRLITDRMDITLEKSEAEVSANGDVRGMLMVDRSMPVGFQSMRCNVDIQAEEEIAPEKIEKLLSYAEHSCVNLQTLETAVEMQTKHVVKGND